MILRRFVQFLTERCGKLFSKCRIFHILDVAGHQGSKALVNAVKVYREQRSKTVYLAHLKVSQANPSEVYKDIVRIHLDHRPLLREGHVIKLELEGKELLGILRGLPLTDKELIRMDALSRTLLNVVPNSVHEFTISSAGLVGQFLWAWRAADPAYRLAAQASLISVGLGALGAILGLWSLYLTLYTK
jgi:hypothetical protein